jgi:hypothetical protein
MPTLGELLMQMGPGTGYPQMAPPMGIPWPPQPAPAPAPSPPAMRPTGSTPQPPQGPTRQALPAQAGGYSTPQAADDLVSALGAFLARSMEPKNPLEPKAASPAMGARGAAQGFEEPVITEPNVLRKPGPGSAPLTGTATPARGNAEMQGGFTPDLTTFDVYGAPIPSRRPADLASLLYSDVPLPEKRTGQEAPSGAKALAKSGPAPTSNAKTPSPAPAPGGGGGGGRPRSPSTFTEAPYGEFSDPHNNLGRFMLQAGLNLMTPSWGGPMANIAGAIGSGAEAIDRASTTRQTEQLNNKKLQLEEARVNKIGLGRKGASSSSGSKRIKEKTPGQEFASTLSPEGALFFNQRLKDLNKAGEDENETADQRMQKILQETQTVDKRARAARGQAKSEEIPDTLLQQVAGTPQESMALNAVASDPVQRALLVTRLEAIKATKAAANATKPK